MSSSVEAISLSKSYQINSPYSVSTRYTSLIPIPPSMDARKGQSQAMSRWIGLGYSCN